MSKPKKDEMSTSAGSASSSKGRATPKRKISEAKRINSRLAPASTKEAKKVQKELARKLRSEKRAAFMRGEESALPARDRGPARRFVRNYVDSRRSIGEYFLPAIMLVLFLTVINQKTALIAAVIMYMILLTTIIDGFFLSRRLKKEVLARFPGTSTKGLGLYGWLRSTQIRRLRAPNAGVKRGDKI